MEKIVCVIMGQNCEKHIGMCLESVKDADAIVYCDGGSTDKTKDKIQKFSTKKGFNLTMKIGDIEKKSKTLKLIENKYNQEDKGMNGKQRNFYLKYIKENYKDYWCIVLDADEVVEDLSKIKDFIQEGDKELIYYVKMRHFIGDLGHEDATAQEHMCPGRLFKVSDELKYPEHSHPILEGKQYAGFKGTTIWHLGHLPVEYMHYIKKRYAEHLDNSIIHKPEFLKQWFISHMFGQYPKKQINPVEIPEIILKNFDIDKDIFYFQNRGLELRHFMMVHQWDRLFFPKSILDLGCGYGPYGKAFKMISGDDVEYTGIEISDYAVKKNPFSLNLLHGDIRTLYNYDVGLVLVLDILEHLDEKDLDKTLKFISSYGNNYLFSIPFIGDPNLNADPTHKIKQSKEWWLEKLGKYFKITDVPNDWLFKEQLLIGEPQ